MNYSFSYFLINLELKYLSGSLFLNSVTTSCAEFVAKLTSAFFILKIGLRYHLISAYALALTGALLLIFIPKPENEWWTSMFLLLTRYGTSMAIVGIYVGLVMLMPTSVVSTSIGICNFFARVLSMCGPLFAEFPEPWPCLSMAFMISAAFISMQFFDYTQMTTEEEDADQGKFQKTQ